MRSSVDDGSGLGRSEAGNCRWQALPFRRGRSPMCRRADQLKGAGGFSFTLVKSIVRIVPAFASHIGACIRVRSTGPSCVTLSRFGMMWEARTVLSLSHNGAAIGQMSSGASGQEGTLGPSPCRHLNGRRDLSRKALPPKTPKRSSCRLGVRFRLHPVPDRVARWQTLLPS